MSSHHIIRENQEPALLLIDVEAISEELLGQLLEWSPIVMTTQDHVDFLLSRGIKVDVIFSTIEVPDNVQEGTIVIESKGREQLYEEVLAYLESKNQFVVHILCDRAFMEQDIFVNERFTVIAFSNNTRYIAAASFEKWLPKGQVLLIEGGCTTNGLVKEGEGEYSVIEDGFVRIVVTDGKKVWIGERL